MAEERTPQFVDHAARPPPRLLPTRAAASREELVRVVEFAIQIRDAVRGVQANIASLGSIQKQLIEWAMGPRHVGELVAAARQLETGRAIERDLDVREPAERGLGMAGTPQPAAPTRSAPAPNRQAPIFSAIRASIKELTDQTSAAGATGASIGRSRSCRRM